MIPLSKVKLKFALYTDFWNCLFTFDDTYHRHIICEPMNTCQKIESRHQRNHRAFPRGRLRCQWWFENHLDQILLQKISFYRSIERWYCRQERRQSTQRKKLHPIRYRWKNTECRRHQMMRLFDYPGVVAVFFRSISRGSVIQHPHAWILRPTFFLPDIFLPPYPCFQHILEVLPFTMLPPTKIKSRLDSPTDHASNMILVPNRKQMLFSKTLQKWRNWPMQRPWYVKFFKKLYENSEEIL
jgi:hypothetical protein